MSLRAALWRSNLTSRLEIALGEEQDRPRKDTTERILKSFQEHYPHVYLQSVQADFADKTKKTKNLR